MLIAHVSDIHITAPPGALSWRDLLGKRLAGWLNLRLGRRYRRFSGAAEIARALVRDLEELAPALTIVTGDLTGLGLELEYQRAAALLGPLCGRDDVLACPGNHDHYVRSAARDKVVQGKREAFDTDQNMTQNAVATALGRGAERHRVNAAIAEAMDRLGIDRSDLTYIRLRKLATGILAAQGIDLAKLSDDELVRVWREALAEAQGRYEKAEAAKEEPTPEGPILLQATAANLIPNIRWTTFAQEMTGRDDCAFRELRMAEAADSLWLELAFELDDATFSGSFSGSMVCKQPPCGQGYTEFSCSFHGKVAEPEQTLVYPDTATGLWKFSGPIDITLSCEGKTVCENRTGPNGEEQITWAEGSRSNVRLRGQISGTAEPGGKATVHVGPPGGTFGGYDGGWWFSLWQGGEVAGRAAIDSDFPPLPTW